MFSWRHDGLWSQQLYLLPYHMLMVGGAILGSWIRSQLRHIANAGEDQGHDPWTSKLKASCLTISWLLTGSGDQWGWMEPLYGPWSWLMISWSLADQDCSRTWAQQWSQLADCQQDWDCPGVASLWHPWSAVSWHWGCLCGPNRANDQLIIGWWGPHRASYKLWCGPPCDVFRLRQWKPANITNI